jgi:hypothetical protein
MRSATRVKVSREAREEVTSDGDDELAGVGVFVTI